MPFFVICAHNVLTPHSIWQHDEAGYHVIVMNQLATGGEWSIHTCRSCHLSDELNGCPGPICKNYDVSYLNTSRRNQLIFGGKQQVLRSHFDYAYSLTQVQQLQLNKGCFQCLVSMSQAVNSLERTIVVIVVVDAC